MSAPSGMALVEQLAASPVNYQSQPCVTFALVDRMHDRKAGTAKRAFNRNKDRFREGEHFHHVSHAELEALPYGVLKTLLGESAKAPRRGLILLTQPGYLFVSKVFTDDLSWQVQDELVKRYFSDRESQAIEAASKAEQLGLFSELQEKLTVAPLALETLEKLGSPMAREFMASVVMASVCDAFGVDGELADMAGLVGEKLYLEHKEDERLGLGYENPSDDERGPLPLIRPGEQLTVDKIWGRLGGPLNNRSQKHSFAIRLAHRYRDQFGEPPLKVMHDYGPPRGEEAVNAYGPDSISLIRAVFAERDVWESSAKADEPSPAPAPVGAEEGGAS